MVSAAAAFALLGAHRAHGVRVRRARVFAGVVDVCTGCIEFFRAVFEVARECTESAETTARVPGRRARTM